MKKINFESIKGNRFSSTINIILGVFVFIFSFLVYLTTLAPTVTAEDSGELITASYFLGIPHPPGYPTWCLLSHPFVYLPFGSIAWRVNLSSAFFASCTVLFIFLFVLRITKNRISAFSSSLIFAFSLEFWEQSVITEVYSLNSLFIILCLYFLCIWKDTKKPGYLLWLSLIYGISLGNHYTMFVVGPFLIAFIFFTNPNNYQYIKIYFLCIIIVLFSWCIVCSYLYIRSLANPPIDWGNPENFTNLFNLITRKQYSFMLTQYPRNFHRFLKQCLIFFSMGLYQFGPPLLFFLSILSFFFTFLKFRSWSLLLFFLGFFTGVFAILVQNFNFDIEWLEVMSVFGIPVYLCCCLSLGIMLAWVLDGLILSSKNKFYFYFSSLFILLLPLVPLYKNYEANDYSHFWFAHEFGENILNSLSPNAIYIPYTDHASFPLFYLQKVEGIRKDITIARVYGYLSPELFEKMDRKQWAKYAPFPKGRYENELIGWLINNTNRPIYSEKKIKVVTEQKGLWVPAGIIYRYQREKEIVPQTESYWEKYNWVFIKENNIKGQPASLIWLQIQWAKARDCFRNNDNITAIELIYNGLKYYGKDDVILNNAGVLCAEYKAYSYAKKFFEEALLINPYNTTVKQNLKKLEKKLKI